LIIDDSKLADIEMINLEKITCNNLAIEDAVDAVTLHAISSLDILKNKSQSLTINFIPIVEMSCNTMIDENYTKKVINTIRTICKEVEYPNLLGLVCQNETPKMINPFEFLTMTPGINIDSEKDSGNQSYTVPNDKNKRGLFWIVGRGITQVENLKEKIKNVEKYFQIGWEYFIKY
jgi:orotidine-5'-phosphate decarboxylase